MYGKPHFDRGWVPFKRLLLHVTPTPEQTPRGIKEAMPSRTTKKISKNNNIFAKIHPRCLRHRRADWRERPEGGVNDFDDTKKCTARINTLVLISFGLRLARHDAPSPAEASLERPHGHARRAADAGRRRGASGQSLAVRRPQSVVDLRPRPTATQTRMRAVGFFARRRRPGQ